MKERNHFDVPGTSEWIKWMFKKDGRPRTELIWLRTDTPVAHCKHDNEPSSSRKCGKSDYPRNYQLPRKKTALFFIKYTTKTHLINTTIF